MKSLVQPNILAPLPVVARSLTFRVAPETDIPAALARMRDGFPAHCAIFGIGEPVVRALGKDIPGLRTFAAMSGPGCSVPSTQDSLWIRLYGQDRGMLFDASQTIRELVGDAFIASDSLDTFVYHGGRDLTRFEDGTENPKGKKAEAAAIVADGEHVKGSSFVAVQQWVHDLDRFHSYPPKRRDDLIGRSAETNEELEDAPESAHVKRSAQQSFDPEAFMWRRSMPWASADRQGLEFIAFVENLDRFERMMRRMAGLDDGIADALFLFSRPITGGYYWCPPMDGDKLDLAALLE